MEVMTSSSFSEKGSSLASLRRLIREPVSAPALLEHCEFCAEGIRAEHRHLLERSNQELHCVCTACALLFGREGSAGGKYLLVPQRYLALSDFQITESEWDDLLIPVNMAFLFRRSNASSPVSAFYPGPAGATESLLSLDLWETLQARNSILNELEMDGEALLINRVRGARDYYIVPIDTCYQLVGLIRSSWRGLSGGEAVWKAIATFFADIRARSTIVLARC
jgi:Family of unknown function (DUF5947)